MALADVVIALAYGAVFGCGYAIAGILLKRDEGEPINPRKAARSIVLWTVSGAIVMVSAGEVSQASIQAHIDQLVIVGLIFDWVWSRARRAGYLNWLDDIPVVGKPR